MDEGGTQIKQNCHRKVVRGRMVARTISLQYECARVLHETLLMPVLMYDSETMILKEKKRSLALGLYRWTTSEVC